MSYAVHLDVLVKRRDFGPRQPRLDPLWEKMPRSNAGKTPSI
jgi:hypothetical protein